MLLRTALVSRQTRLQHCNPIVRIIFVTQRSNSARLLPLKKGRKKSRKSQKFSLRFLSAARAEGTFCDFCEFLCDKKQLLQTVIIILVGEPHQRQKEKARPIQQLGAATPYFYL